MRAFRIPGRGPETTLGFTPREKRRLFVLSLASALVAAVIAGLLLRSRSSGDLGGLPAGEPEELAPAVSLPAVDAQRLDALVQDARAEDRVVLESEALDVALDTARLLTPRHFRAMDQVELDAATAAGLLADPGAQRGRPFLARGWIEELRQRQRGPANAPEHPPLHVGQLLLEDGTVAYFVALQLPDDSLLGDYVRVDGLFLKVFSDESSEQRGTWIEGPLLVAPQAIRSYPDLGRVTEIDPKFERLVLDDYLLSPAGEAPRMEGLPFEALWHLMAYVRDLPAGAVDWSSAPELDGETLRAVLADGRAHRFQPFRIPLGRLQGNRVRRPGENPARMAQYSEGWIGNTTWKNVIQFQAPTAYHDLELADYVHGRGFFLKNFAYESAQGLRVAPAFVLVSLHSHVPSAPPLFRHLTYAVVGTTVLLTLLFVVLLRRDKRSSERFERDLVRRRRARAERRAGSAVSASP